MPLSAVGGVKGGGPLKVVRADMRTYTDAAHAFPLGLSRVETRMRDAIFRRLRDGGPGCGVGGSGDAEALGCAAGFVEWLDTTEPFLPEWRRLAVLACEALHGVVCEEGERFTGDDRFVAAADVRTLLLLLQRAAVVYDQAGAAGPSDIPFLDFAAFSAAFHHAAGLWGASDADAWQAFRSAGAEDAPGGSLLPLPRAALHILRLTTPYLPPRGLPPAEYVVVAPSAIVREGRALAAPQVGAALAEGARVTVVDVIGRRALLQAPVQGWVSVHTQKGEAILALVTEEREGEGEEVAAADGTTGREDDDDHPGEEVAGGAAAAAEEVPHVAAVASAVQQEEEDGEDEEGGGEETVATEEVRGAEDSMRAEEEGSVRGGEVEEGEGASFSPPPASRPTGSRGSFVASRLEDGEEENVEAEPPVVHRRGGGNAGGRSGSVSRRGFVRAGSSGGGSRVAARGFCKPTQSACMRMRDESGALDFRKYPWDYRGQVAPQQRAAAERREAEASAATQQPAAAAASTAGGAARRGEMRYLFGKAVQRSTSSSAAFRSTTRRDVSAFLGRPASDSPGPGSYTRCEKPAPAAPPVIATAAAPSSPSSRRYMQPLQRGRNTALAQPAEAAAAQGPQEASSGTAAGQSSWARSQTRRDPWYARVNQRDASAANAAASAALAGGVAEVPRAGGAGAGGATPGPTRAYARSGSVGARRSPSSTCRPAFGSSAKRELPKDRKCSTDVSYYAM